MDWLDLFQCYGEDIGIKKCAAQGFKCVRKDMCEGMETSDADCLFIGLKFLLLLHLLSV